MNNGVHVSFSVLVSSGYIPKSEIADSYGGFIPSFYFIYYYYYYFLLYNVVLVLPYINMHPPRVYTCSPS